jgi:hypothetical protein
MNIAEILRGLADKLDGEQPQQGPQSAQLHPAQAQQDENPEVNTDSMVSPLQQKLELLKKAAGVDNAYDDGEIAGGEEHGCEDCGADPCQCDGGEDELDAMKRMAGLPVVVQMAGADNDIED